MSWLEAVFRGKKPTAEDHPDGALETVTFEGGSRPGWLTETGLFRAVSHSSVAGREPWTPATINDELDPFAPPLPKRTRAGS